MFKFFRRIRQRLLKQNKLGKYLIYAGGEIVLVVIGILIALSVNNGNERRKGDEKFNAILEQIYTIIDQETQQFEDTKYRIDQQLEIIQQISKDPKSIDPALLPSLLFYLDQGPRFDVSQITTPVSTLAFDPKNVEQSRLFRNITAYSTGYQSLSQYTKPRLRSYLKEQGLPEPALSFGFSTLNNYQEMDRTFFSVDQQVLSLEMLEQTRFQNLLKSLRSQKQLLLHFLDDAIADGQTNKALIKQYYPAAKLLYHSIGVVGDATAFNNYFDNIPMELTDPQNAIWEVQIELKDGTVKFRDGNSWLSNWGGSEFPDGQAQWFGENIQVKAGTYHIELNLEEKTYAFELIK